MSINIHPKRQNWINQRLKWAVGAVLAILIISAAIQYKKSGEVSAVKVLILDEEERKFLSERSVRDIVRQQLGYSLEGRPAESINLAEVESALETNAFIDNADVYISAHNTVTLRISQRNPIVRIMQPDGKSYYLDPTGKYMPSTSAFAARVPVCTGYTGKFDENYNSTPGHIVADIFKLAQFINKDKFLHALTEQIYLDDNHTFYISPKIGDHTIVLGDTNDLDDKFQRLKTFYTEGLSRKGWDKYRLLSLRYKGQLVAVKY